MHRQDLWNKTVVVDRHPDGRPKTTAQEPTSRHGKGLRYRVRSKDPLVPSRSFAKASDADAYIKKHTRNALAVELGLADLSHGDTTPLRTVAAAWESTWTVRGKTPGSYRSQLHKHVLPAYGDTPVGAISVFNVVEFRSHMINQGYAHSTVKNALGVFRQILNTAVQKNLIKANPAASVKMPKDSARIARKRQKAKVVFLTAREVNLLAAAMPHPDLALMVQFVAFSGLRAGENAGLRVSDFDFAKGIVHIERNIFVTDRPRTDADPEEVAKFESEEAAARKLGLSPCHRIGPPKNGEPRDVALPAFMIERLEAYLEQSGRKRRDWFWPDLEFPRIDKTAHPDRDGRERNLVLTRNCLNHGDFYRYVYTPAAEDLGLNPNLTFHSLRHTCAALLISRGVDAKTLQVHMGHQSYDITMDTYGHLYEEAQANLGMALQDVWETLSALDRDLEHLSGKAPLRTSVPFSVGAHRGHSVPDKQMLAPRVTSTYGVNFACVSR